MKKILIATAVLSLFATAASAANYAEVGVGGGFQSSGTSDRAASTDLSVIVGTDTPWVKGLRAEVEADRAFGNGGRIGSVSATSIGGNLAYDLPYTYHNVTPYVFAGVGEAFLDGSGVKSGSTTGPYFAVGAGANYRINADWSAGVRYKYEQANAQVVDNAFTHCRPSFADYRDNSVQVTVTRKF